MAGDTENAFPLSFVQERLRLLERLSPQGREPLRKRLTLRGGIAERDVVRGVQLVHERHALLRTEFFDAGRESVQRPLSAALCPAQIEGIEQEPAPSAGACPGTAVWRLDGAELELELRSLACDGFSLRLLLNDLATAVKGASPLPPVEIAYHEYAQQERAAWSAATADRCLAAWRSLLAGVEPTSLPREEGLPAGEAVPEVTQACRRFGSEMSAALASWTRTINASTAAAGLAAWHSALRDWSGADEPLTFVAVSRRHRRGLQSTIGPFTDFLPLPARPVEGAASSVKDMAGRLLTLLEHSTAPMQTAVQALPAGIAGPGGPFSSLYTYVPRAPGNLVPPWKQEDEPSPEHFDLHFVVLEGDDGLELRLRAPGGGLSPAAVEDCIDEITGRLRGLALGRSERDGPGMGRKHLAPSSKPDPDRPAPARLPDDPTGQSVRRAWQSVLGVEPRDADEDFRSAGGHSLLVPELATAIERELGVSMPLELICRPHVSVRTLCDAVRGIVPPRPLDASSPGALRADAVERLPPGPFPPPPEAPRQWMLTGATGYLGAHILVELLERPETKVWCLVRAASLPARDRLARALAKLRLAERVDWDRVEVVEGDLASPGLGLAAGDSARLAGSVQAIVHAGAWVNFIYPYSVLAPVNVEGTSRVCELASSCRRCRVHHVSSLGAAEVEEAGGAAGGYALSKWVAEELMLEAAARGLPVDHSRPPWIIGHSATGACQASDFLWAMLISCVELGSAPDLDFPVLCATADDVGRAIVDAGFAREPAREMVPVGVVPDVTWRLLLDALVAGGHPLETVPSTDWVAQVEHRELPRMRPFLDLVRERTRGGRWEWASQPPPADTSDATTTARDILAIVNRCVEYLDVHGEGA